MTPRAPLPPLAEVFAGRHLVVTGATGFLGKVWLSHLLYHLPEIGRVTLLIRPRRGQGGLQRFATLADTSPAFRPLKEALGPDYAAFLSRRVEVIDADVTEPGCGLSEADTARLAATADAVVHIAGLTDFHPDPRKGVPANVEGSLHAADLAARLQVPRLVHVSTCYVAGTNDGETPERLDRGVAPSGDTFDPIDELDQLRDLISLHGRVSERTDLAAERARRLGWPNLYTYTKGLAEHLLASRDDLELTIARPSVVECARTWPFPGWNEDLNTSAPIMWFCGTPFPELPSRGAHRFDIVPVDAVARWLTVITARHLRGEAHRVYQLATSDLNPTTFDRIIELTALGKRRHARRPSASLREKVVAALDVRAGSADEPPLLSPGRLERLGSALLDRLVKPARVPAPLEHLVDDGLQAARRRLTRSRRELARLHRMLDLYRPFIHDHDWRFWSDHVRSDQDALHPSDRPAFYDDAHQMCWRAYWLDVQYPGMVRWSFPIMDGEEVAGDPPSTPPLTLVHPDTLADDVPSTAIGAA